MLQSNGDWGPALNGATEQGSEMNTGFLLWLFAVSVGASALGGMLGMASGIFIVPILIIFGPIDIHSAIAASIVSVIACSCGSAAPFLRAGLTNIRLAIVLETATTLGALRACFWRALFLCRFCTFFSL